MKEKHPEFEYILQMIENLETYEKGENAPYGFGAAAVIPALMAIEMMKADYDSKTFESQYRAIDYSFNEVKALLEEEYKPKLRESFRREFLMIDSINKLTSDEQNSPDKKKKDALKKERNENLKAAFYLNINICRGCISLLKLALDIYHDGFISKYAGTGAVISNIHLSVCNSYSVLLLNLKLFSSEKWIEEATSEAAQLWEEYQPLKLSSVRRIMDLCKNKE